MSDKVKTIIFSELPKNDKVKYFQFLIENDINFTKDDNGNYVALIKVLNPSAYSKDLNNEKANLKLNQNVSQGYDRLNNIDQNNESQGRSEKKKKLSSSMIKVKSDNQGITIGNKNKKDNRPNSLSKSEIISKATNSLDYLKATYGEFVSLLNPLIGVRPMKMNYYQLKYQIEELYAIKFMLDTVTIKNKLNAKFENEVITESFQKFIIDYKSEKFLKKHLIDKNILDILLSADYYKDKRDIEIFLAFLNNQYDSDDLIFYLFVRTCIEKEMKMMFMEKAREEVKLQHYEERDTEIYINNKTCLKSKILLYRLILYQLQRLFLESQTVILLNHL